MAQPLDRIPLEGLLRVDASLEGAWAENVMTIWTPDSGVVDLKRVPLLHNTYKPSLEFVFATWWVGVHCYRRVDGVNRFDSDRARSHLHVVVGERFMNQENLNA